MVEEREEAVYVDTDKDGKWKEELLYPFLLLVKLLASKVIS